MKKVFLIFIVFITFCLVSCNERNNNIQSINFYFYESSRSEAIFKINNNYYSVRKYPQNEFSFNSNKDTLYNKFSNEYFVKKNLLCNDFIFDTIELANSNGDFCFGKFGNLFNIRIINNTWKVSLYYPFDDYPFDFYKGTFQFEIYDEERLIINSLLSELINNNLNTNYFPTTKSKNIFSSQGIASLYVRTYKNGKYSEWFGAFENRELNLLDQFATIINEKYIGRHNKYSEQIMLLDIRKRFNDFWKIDERTGSLVVDFDSITPPPLP